MEREFFLNAGMPVWPSAMEIQANASANEMNNICSASEQSSPAECFFNPNNNWEKSTDHSLQFDSALSSIVSSPVASNSNSNFPSSNDSFMIRELIGKLGNINGSNNNNSTNTSCYTTPLNSPPKLNSNLPIMDNFVNDKLPTSGHPVSMHLSSTVADFSADPGFAERAARFSRFGSRSFNGRPTSNTNHHQFVPSPGPDHQFGGAIRSSTNHHHLNHPVTGNEKLPRVSSSPSLKALLLGSQGAVPESRSELANSQEESSVSEQVLNRDSASASASAALKASNDFNSRKRKAVSKAKSKDPAKVAGQTNENFNKRCKPNEGNASRNGAIIVADEELKTGDEKQANKTAPTNNNTKPPEPPKDYIHVRARRGQATDSHSLAERVRREKISERMKLLQDLVPGCNKVTGKALMLDEIINYVQSLQGQVEFLSMKLSSVNTRLDFNVDAIMSKDMYQPNKPLAHSMFPTDPSASAFFGHQQLRQNPAPQSSFSDGTMTQCPPDPLQNLPLCGGLNMQHHFPEAVPQFHNLCEDDLQSIVQMGFGQSLNRETSLQLQNFHGSNQAPHTKIEL